MKEVLSRKNSRSLFWNPIQMDMLIDILWEKLVPALQEDTPGNKHSFASPPKKNNNVDHV